MCNTFNLEAVKNLFYDSNTTTLSGVFLASNHTGKGHFHDAQLQIHKIKIWRMTSDKLDIPPYLHDTIQEQKT